MTTRISESSSFSGSAKIYAFPARGRFVVSKQRDELTTAAKVQLPSGAQFASTNGWYHEEAIRAEEQRGN
jgi:hypothetical protein